MRLLVRLLRYDVPVWLGRYDLLPQGIVSHDAPSGDTLGLGVISGMGRPGGMAEETPKCFRMKISYSRPKNAGWPSRQISLMGWACFRNDPDGLKQTRWA